MRNTTKFTIPPHAREKYPVVAADAESLDLHSWFTSTGLVAESAELATDRTVLRCRRVVLKPTPEQHSRLQIWFRLYQYAYNRTIKKINTDIANRTKPVLGFQKLRTAVKATFGSEICGEIKRSGVPVHTIDNAVRDVTKAFKSAIAQCIISRRRFRVRYKRANSKSLVLECSAFSSKRNAFAIKTLGDMRSNEPFGSVKHDCRLVYRNGVYTVYIPTDRPVRDALRDKSCCSLDPGVRTFQTAYCDDGAVLEFGTGVTAHLTSLHERLDRGRTERFRRRLRKRIRDIVDDLHWKTARAICHLSDTILIGDMSTQGVIGRRQAGLQPMTKRVLVSLSHYQFRQRLQSKCEELGVAFEVVNESYTSKTCGGCGEINNSLGSSKTFHCPCGFRLDRDVNGARNIMIKHLQ